MSKEKGTTVVFKYPLGIEAKDKVTGFVGIITTRTEHLTGCNTYGLTPKVDEKKQPGDSHGFDEGRIEFVSEGINAKEIVDGNLDGKRGASESPKMEKTPV